GGGAAEGGAGGGAAEGGAGGGAAEGGAGGGAAEGGAGGQDGAGPACAMVTDDTEVLFTSITRLESSAAECPELGVDDVNNDDGEGGEGGDGDDDCEPVFDLAACSGTLDCPESGLTGQLNVTNDGITGTFTLMLGEITCEYAIEADFR
ncbi:MAG: hypothetical protein ACI9U2_000448, partial [Bradymonadia bacterium]